MVSLRRSVALTAAGAVLVYVVTWLGYRHDWAWLNPIDSSSLSALYHLGADHPGWIRFWQFVCTAFGPGAFRLLGALVVVILLVRRQLRTALFLVASVELSGVITQAAKGLADRPRPETALVVESSSSFPSGHALEVMVGVLALLSVLRPLLRRRLRSLAVVVGALVVLAVGFGRVALNVHHVSDVLAGWALGYLYFLVCALVFRR
ncbi:phosphatase PAP2 family protein [Mycobacterium shimoidei]|uniref:phosphatase PAP2 family protein n=1 Tax=Mycobacterium shimoidei TaxID=29313 RepID=UPI00111C18EA|nr:phosphatase PAP2 family protein [Mycobacterium shimoidei]